jgi:pimeloyl-ACP methyl ester carboxylesterase
MDRYKVPPRKIPGTVHTVKHLQAFELSRGSGANALVFIGGLGDGLMTVPYVSELQMPSGWTCYQLLFSSSYNGWGTGSLDRDIDEIDIFVKYLRSLGKEKIVLMGHSTGTQDSIHYLLNKGDVEGIILQASVSDRDAMSMFFDHEKAEELNNEVRTIKDQYGEDHILPKKFSDLFFGAPINCYRWLSLATVSGDDDYFSSDLSDEKLKNTMGKITKPVCFLYSGSDEFVPSNVNKKELLSKWLSFVPSEYVSDQCKVVEGATHNVGPLSTPEALPVLIDSVYKFLESI